MGVGIKSAETERKSGRVSRRLGKSMTATVIELAERRQGRGADRRWSVHGHRKPMADMAG